MSGCLGVIAAVILIILIILFGIFFLGIGLIIIAFSIFDDHPIISVLCGIIGIAIIVTACSI